MLDQFPPALKQLLEDPSRIKCGVNIRSSRHARLSLTVDDAARLAMVYSVLPAGLLELGRMAQAVDGPRLANLGFKRSVISLERLAQTYLGKPIKKDLGISDWDQPYLSYPQKICKLLPQLF